MENIKVIWITINHTIHVCSVLLLVLAPIIYDLFSSMFSTQLSLLYTPVSLGLKLIKENLITFSFKKKKSKRIIDSVKHSVRRQFIFMD